MPDHQPDPVIPATPEQLRRRKRGQNLAILLALVLWVVIIYVAIMVKVHHEIRG